MWSSAKFRVEPGFFLLLALSVLLGAGNVLPVLLLAAACHEGAHLGVLALFRIPVKTISLTAAGIEIQAPMQTRLSYGRELLAVAAGPLCNLVLALLAARWAGWYLFAGASFLLGLFNLLPAAGEDGGALAREIETRLGAQTVAVIGRKAILYRRSSRKDFDHIVF